MEKKISVSELFELIRKGEQPAEFKYDNGIAYWDKKTNKYIVKSNGWPFAILASKVNSHETITYDEPILDKAERKYLSDVIRPFRSRVVSIKKKRNNNGEYLFICVKANGICDNASFPDFEVGTMYKGMEREKPYTLEELGL